MRNEGNVISVWINRLQELFNTRQRLWFLGAGVLAVVLIAGQISGGFSSSAPDQQGVISPAAQEETPYLAEGYAQLEEPEKQAQSSSFGSILGGMFIPLILVIASIYAVLRGLKYVNARLPGTDSSARMIKSLDTLSLGQNRSVHVLQLGSRVIVVGAGAGQLSLLTELDAEQADELLASSDSESTSSARSMQSFQAILGPLINSKT